MRYALTLTVLLSLFWLGNSGHYTGLLLTLGMISIATVMFLARNMLVIDDESQPIHLFPDILVYWLWLIKEIIWANMDVTRRIWAGPGAIQPSRLTIETSSHTDLGKALFANSVTLTPGTVTLEISGKHVVIHALSQRSTAGLASIDRRVSKIE